jgi:hypothetical protein
MDIVGVREHILELCAESEHGSWEFWTTDEKTDEEGRLIAEAITRLVGEGKIYPVEHISIQDRTYKNTSLVSTRLQEEIHRSKYGNVDPNSFYWFVSND